MRKTFLLLTALAATLAMTRCTGDNKDIEAVERMPDPRVSALTPWTSPLLGAELGSNLTITGKDLSVIHRISVGGYDAEITSASDTEIVATIPFADYSNEIESNSPYTRRFLETVVAYSRYGKDVAVYTSGEFYIDRPVTEPAATAGPLSGIAGHQVELGGINLDNVIDVYFGSVRADIEPGATSTNLFVVIPSSDVWLPGENIVELKVTYGDPLTEKVIAPEFRIYIPKANTPAVTSGGIGDEIEITGIALNYIDVVSLAGVEAIITGQSATSLKFQIVDGDFLVTGTAVNIDVLGHYGNPPSQVALIEGFVLNTMMPDVEPFFESLEIEDPSADNGSYLLKSVTIKGTGLNGISAITVGGLDAELAATGNSATSLTFTMPDDFTFDTATACDVVATYGSSGLTKQLTHVKVYPFYYWKNITLGSNAAANWDKAFFLPDRGIVYSTDMWMGYVDGVAQVDVPANLYKRTSEGWTADKVHTAAHTINRTLITDEAMYRSVEPYFFSINTGSPSYISAMGPSAQVPQIRKYMLSNGSAIWSEYGPGTPMITWRNLTGATYADLASSVRERTIESIAAVDVVGTSSTVSYQTAGAGSVLLMSYLSYNHPGGTSVNIANVYKTGFLVVKEVNAVWNGAGTAHTSNSTMSFDFFWPKNDR